MSGRGSTARSSSPRGRGRSFRTGPSRRTTVGAGTGASRGANRSTEVQGGSPKVRVGGEVNSSWGGPATFRYRLSDNLATALRCKLVITYHGKVVAVKQLGLRPVGRRLSATLTRLIPSHGGDAYGRRIVAFDTAGNRAVGTGGEFEVWRGPWH